MRNYVLLAIQSSSGACDDSALNIVAKCMHYCRQRHDEGAVSSDDPVRLGRAAEIAPISIALQAVCDGAGHELGERWPVMDDKWGKEGALRAAGSLVELCLRSDTLIVNRPWAKTENGKEN